MSRWPTVPLGSIVGIEIGRTPSRADPSMWDTENRTNNTWLSIADLTAAGARVVSHSRERITEKATKDARMVPKGTLLMSFKLSIGKLGFAGCDLFTNEAIASFTFTDNTPVTKEYLFYFLLSRDWIKQSVGNEKVLGATLNKEKLKSLEISYPESLEEQKRIVALLDATFAKIAAAEEKQKAVAKNAVELFKSISNDLLTGNPDAPMVPLGDISTVSYGYTESAQAEAVGPKFLRITDIQNGCVDWSKVPYCVIDDGHLKRQALKHGDIVFARTGATTGKSFLVVDPPLAVSASYLIRVQPRAAVIDSYFLNFNFQTSAYWREIQAGLSGSAQSGFNASKLAALIIRVPPLEKQKRIVTLLDGAKEQSDKVAANAARELECLAEVKASVLHGAFEGAL